MNYGVAGGIERRSPHVLHEVSGGSATGPRLSQAILSPRGANFAAIAPLPSNVEAIEAALQFVAGGSMQVAITGPSGTGKSHLLQAVAGVADRTLGAPLEIVSAEAFLGTRRSFDVPGPLVLDDVQVALGRPRMRQDLRRILEARTRRAKPTLTAFTIDPGPMGTLGLRAVQGLLPSPRTWTIAQIKGATADERPALLAHVSRAEGLRLSSALSQVLARELGGNGHTLVGAMRRLRLERSDWTTSRQTLRALGLLDPFFSDNSSWDLRHLILREAERHRTSFPQFSPVELALYTMLHEARLCERSVAEYLGKAPAEAYGLAARFGLSLKSDADGPKRIEEFIEFIVRSLIR